MRRTRIAATIWLAMTGLLAACGNPQPTSTVAPSPQPTSTVAPSATEGSIDEATCVNVDLAVCAEVVAAAVNNLGRNHVTFRPPAMVVQDACPDPMPGYADGPICWAVTLPLAGGEAPVVIMARRQDGVVAQVGGDSISGAATPDG